MPLRAVSSDSLSGILATMDASNADLIIGVVGQVFLLNILLNVLPSILLNISLPLLLNTEP
jgi:hypothetical protein